MIKIHLKYIWNKKKIIRDENWRFFLTKDPLHSVLVSSERSERGKIYVMFYYRMFTKMGINEYANKLPQMLNTVCHAFVY